MGGFSGVGIEQQAELAEGVGVVLTSAAYIAHPGREIRDGDQLFAQPGKVRHVVAAHLSGLTFGARDGTALCAHSVNFFRQGFLA